MAMAEARFRAYAAVMISALTKSGATGTQREWPGVLTKNSGKNHLSVINADNKKASTGTVEGGHTAGCDLRWNEMIEVVAVSTDGDAVC